MSLLAVEGLSVAYGDMLAVRDVSFAFDEGEVFVLLGANGAGKTSILRCISGMVPARGGARDVRRAAAERARPHQVARAGISHVPEGRRIFPNLTVEENLERELHPRPCAGYAARRCGVCMQLFPRLAERRRQFGGTLSGGEQQMLAIGRAMMGAEAADAGRALARAVAGDGRAGVRAAGGDPAQGATMLLVEQNATCLELATRRRHPAERPGAAAGVRDALQDSEFVRRAYLGV